MTSLRSARHLHPDARRYPRWFRTNVLLGAVEDQRRDYPEDARVGAGLRLGAAQARVRKTATRGVVTAQTQPGLGRDVGIFPALGRVRGGNLGIYVDPQGHGVVAGGDPVELVG